MRASASNGQLSKSVPCWPQMRTSSPDETQLVFLAFDMLVLDGVDLRGLPLSDRKRDLHRLCRKARVPFLKQVETFPDMGVGVLIAEYE